MNDHETKADTTNGQTSIPKAANKRKSRIIRALATMSGLVVVIAGLFLMYAYFSTPTAIRKPAFQHYHFRMQVLVDGKAVNFAEKEFQTDTAKDVCSAQLTQQPIHFHDDKDQMVHIHWDGMTGGLVLKYYGWNYAGGLHGTLGFRFDNLPKLVNVPIHGNTLPTVPQGDKFYVYTGDEHSYKERTFDDFVHKDLEDFFGKKSNLPGGENTSFLGKLFPKAYAHGADELAVPTSASVDQEELKRINNLIGNVVIFAQKDHPTDKQIKDRFNKLAPLSLSTCAG
jgi:hypothetical protein